LMRGERVTKGFPPAGRLSEGPPDGPFTARLNRAALGALLLLTLANGCAMQPPSNNTNAFTGPRLVVRMTYQGSQALGGYGINPYYYYFFVINYAVTPQGSSTVNLAGNKQAPGPVPVVTPGPGPNGFVIGSDGST